MSLSEFAIKMGFESEEYSDVKDAVREARASVTNSAAYFREIGIVLSDEQIEQAAALAGLRTTQEIRAENPHAFGQIINSLKALELRADQKLLIDDGILSLEKARDQWREEIAEQRLKGNQGSTDEIIEYLSYDRDERGNTTWFRCLNSILILREKPEKFVPITPEASEAFQRSMGLPLSTNGLGFTYRAIPVEPATTLQVMQALGIRALGAPSYTENSQRRMITRFGKGIEAEAYFKGDMKGIIRLDFSTSAMAAAIKQQSPLD